MYFLIQFSRKMSKVFGNNSLKMSVSFNKNFLKIIILQYCLLVTLKVLTLFLSIAIVKETEMALKGTEKVQQNAVATLFVPLE